MEVRLQKARFGIRAMLTRKLLEDAEVDLEEYVDNLISLEVRSFIYATEEPYRRYHLEYPADWWEAFKERWLPFLPVNRKILHVDVLETYPDFHPRIQGQRAVLHIMKTESEFMTSGITPWEKEKRKERDEQTKNALADGAGQGGKP